MIKQSISMLSTLILSGLTLISLFVLSMGNVSADDNDTVVDDIHVSVPVSCNMTGTGMNSHTATMDPGEYRNHIGVTTLKTVCNDANGFAIYAIGYSNNEYGNTELITNNANPGASGTASGNIITGTAQSGNTSNWAMRIDKVTDTSSAYNPNNLTITNGFDGNGVAGVYHIVPSDWTKVANYTATTDMGETALGSKIQSTYAAYVTAMQAPGTYEGQVTYRLVHPSTAPAPVVPVVTDPGFISYNPNAAGVTDTMADQSISTTATSANLWASNFQRPGYGFAGWNTEPDYSGTSYGPNETISFTAGQYSGSNPGLSLYAIWVPSDGDLQSWTGCSALTKANEATDILSQSITALTDQRDQQTYAVARLADGNCWMIENLRLDNQYTTSAADIAKAQGYDSSFIGLADPENTRNWNNSTTANSLYSTDGSTSAPAITGSNQGYRFPRYNNQNTASPATNMTAWNNSANTYSVGNWYTWSAAIADTSNYTTSGQTIANTSICPTGWHIPTGSTGGEFSSLDSAMGGTGGSQSTAEASLRWRKYPQNFIYSGYFYSGSASNRGSYGYYWSSTVRNYGYSYYLFLYSSNVNPGPNSYDKYRGLSVRCLAQ